MYRKVIKTTKEISKEEAQDLIAEARIPVHPCFHNELDAYQNDNGMLRRMFTLTIPNTWWDTKDSDFLLSYARANMPDDLTFG